jgi:membrane protein DedA with SNARE-associated domain
MGPEQITAAIVTFVHAHEVWAAPVVLLLAFGESLAFISLLLPATVILLGLGALIGSADLAFWPLWLAAAAGAMLGDWLSFWLGKRFGHGIAGVWPLSRHPTLIPRGHVFFEKWGIAGVFLGRFFGPLRAAVPLVAGICEMPERQFQLANVTSAFVWATGVLAPGAFGMPWLRYALAWVTGS